MALKAKMSKVFFVYPAADEHKVAGAEIEFADELGSAVKAFYGGLLAEKLHVFVSSQIRFWYYAYDTIKTGAIQFAA